jgi:hypothetical protein
MIVKKEDRFFWFNVKKAIVILTVAFLFYKR